MTGWGRLGAAWGLAGVCALLGFAVYRLGLVTLDAFTHSLDWRHWTLLGANVVFMAYTEGYLGFQRAFSPRVVARARHLAAAPTATRVAFAPLFCMAYFHATRRRLVATYLLSAAIVVLIAVYHHIAQPWRGVLDAGIVVGLVWGIASIGALATRAFSGRGLDASPELPGD